MKIGSAPRGSTFTILPPAVVMAANNYYGLPQVWEGDSPWVSWDQILELCVERLYTGSQQWGSIQQRQLLTLPRLPALQYLLATAPQLLPLLQHLMQQLGQQHRVCCPLPIQPIPR